MTTKIARKIVKIDEEKCNGCGSCVPACAEGALQIIDGKAKLIKEIYCDGLGACLGECPQGAITIEERDAEEFDEKAVEQHLREIQMTNEELPCGCPSSTVTQFQKQEAGCDCATANLPRLIRDNDLGDAHSEKIEQPSLLMHWPVQLTLVPPKAPFLQGANVVLAADCVPFSYASFHNDFLKDHTLLVACPKLDDFQAHLRKLTEVLKQSDILSITVVHMEVPCCAGLVHLADKAIQASGKDIPLHEVTVSTRGEIVPLAS